MLHEPLILISAFFLLFLLSIIYVRMDFSITVDEGKEAKMKVAGLCEKVAAIQVSNWKFCWLIQYHEDLPKTNAALGN